MRAVLKCHSQDKVCHSHLPISCHLPCQTVVDFCIIAHFGDVFSIGLFAIQGGHASRLADSTHQSFLFFSKGLSCFY